MISFSCNELNGDIEIIAFSDFLVSDFESIERVIFVFCINSLLLLRCCRLLLLLLVGLSSGDSSLLQSFFLLESFNDRYEQLLVGSKNLRVKRALLFLWQGHRGQLLRLPETVKMLQALPQTPTCCSISSS